MIETVHANHVVMSLSNLILSTVQETEKNNLGCPMHTKQTPFSASVGSEQSCDRSGSTFLGGDSGYISSTALNSTVIGTPQCPWTITVQPGQTIDFTLFDFTLKDSGRDESSSPTGGTGSEHECPVQSVFTESNVPTVKSLCNGSLRQRYLFSSGGHKVRVHFNKFTTNVPLFFLSYEGKARHVEHFFFLRFLSRAKLEPQ